MINRLKTVSIGGLGALAFGAAVAATTLPADAQVFRSYSGDGYAYGMAPPMRSKLAAGYEYEYLQPYNYSGGLFNPQPNLYGNYGYDPYYGE